MSNARRLRQQKELEALQASAPAAATGEDEKAEVDEKPRIVANPFAALGGDGEDNDDDDDNDGESDAEPASAAATAAPSSKKVRWCATKAAAKANFRIEEQKQEEEEEQREEQREE